MYTQSSPFQKKSKIKGGGTKKVCLPASKVRSMSAAEKKKVIAAKDLQLLKEIINALVNQT